MCPFSKVSPLCPQEDSDVEWKFARKLLCLEYIGDWFTDRLFSSPCLLPFRACVGVSLSLRSCLSVYRKTLIWIGSLPSACCTWSTSGTSLPVDCSLLPVCSRSVSVCPCLYVVASVSTGRLVRAVEVCPQAALHGVHRGLVY